MPHIVATFFSFYFRVHPFLSLQNTDSNKSSRKKNLGFFVMGMLQIDNFCQYIYISLSIYRHTHTHSKQMLSQQRSQISWLLQEHSSILTELGLKLFLLTTLLFLNRDQCFLIIFFNSLLNFVSYLKPRLFWLVRIILFFL